MGSISVTGEPQYQHIVYNNSNRPCCSMMPASSAVSLLLNIPQPSKRGGPGGAKPEEPAYGTSWFYL
ncbi:MAG: hypothetical protein LBH43_07800 [Treponema sp.]|nr:hypothetical protein [Treponema sp.]